jgi:hypothetical protein
VRAARPFDIAPAGRHRDRQRHAEQIGRSTGSTGSRKLALMMIAPLANPPGRAASAVRLIPDEERDGHEADEDPRPRSGRPEPAE